MSDLQQHPAEDLIATASCGCRVVRNGTLLGLTMCPLHAAAEEMLATLGHILECPMPVTSKRLCDKCRDEARAAIEKATSKQHETGKET